MPPMYKKKFGKPINITRSQPTAKKSIITPLKSSTQTNDRSFENRSIDDLLKKSAITPEQIDFKANIPTESASFQIKRNNKKTTLDELCINEFYNKNQSRNTRSSVNLKRSVKKTSSKVFQSPKQPKTKVKNVVNNSIDAENNFETSSQISNDSIVSTSTQSQKYKDDWHRKFDTGLNQPLLELTQKERSDIGLCAQCDECNKWRHLPEIMDPLDLPEFWYCRLNEDQEFNKCSVPEPEEDEDSIYIKYNAGSIVWVKLLGFPWWPAMVDNDPENECYYWLEGDSDVPTWYHVVFFDSKEVSRAWVKPQKIVGYKNNLNNKKYKINRNHRKLFVRYETAKKQAQDALKLTILQRLKKYSFTSRWTKPIRKLTIHVDDVSTIMNNERKNKSKNKTNMVEKRKTNDKDKSSKKLKSQQLSKAPTNNISVDLFEDSSDMSQNDFLGFDNSPRPTCESLTQFVSKSIECDSP